MTIIEFLEARIAEDEALARDIVQGESWWVDGPGESSGQWWIYDIDTKFPLRETALHIARHHPKRVLAECEAKREIIKQHKDWPVLVEQEPSFNHDGSDVQSMTLSMTRKIAWLTEREYVKRFGVEPPTAPMIRTLAAIYADHPDYRQEWA